MVDACRTVDMTTRLETIEVRGGTAVADRTEEGRSKGREGWILNEESIIEQSFVSSSISSNDIADLIL